MNRVIIGSGNSLSLVCHQAIIKKLCLYVINKHISVKSYFKFSFKRSVWNCSAKCYPSCLDLSVLTHWGRVTHICIIKLAIIGSDNGLSPGRCQTIIWTNVGILSIGPLGTNFTNILIRRIFNQENVFESIIWMIVAILSWPVCVNKIDFLVTCVIIKVSPCIQCVDDYVDWQLASSVCSQGFQGIVDVTFQYPWVTNIYSTNGTDQPLCTYRAVWKPLRLQE